MKLLKAGQLATLVNKDRHIGCVIKVTKKESPSVCEECKKNNYEALFRSGFCLMSILNKDCEVTILPLDAYPKVVKFFEV